jgi:serine/threonine-protein kinase RsbW
MLVKEPKKGGTASMKKSINFSSVPENLALVERMVDEICSDYSINEDHYGNILISITEAVNNAIQHGNKYDPGKQVLIEFDADNDLEHLCFRISDEGEGFDVSSLPDPTEPGNTEKLSGRGVFLMRNLADNVGFSSDGREVELNFKVSVN